MEHATDFLVLLSYPAASLVVLIVVFLIQPNTENTQFHGWGKITFCRVKPSAEKKHSGIYFSISTVAAATWNSGCGFGGPVLSGCQCWEQEFILYLSHRKRSNQKKKSIKQASSIRSCDSTLIISLLGLSSLVWIRPSSIILLVKELMWIESRNTLIDVFHKHLILLFNYISCK